MQPVPPNADELLKQVWGTPYESEMHILRVNNSNLRRKIEPEPSRPHCLLTEPSAGYRIRVEVFALRSPRVFYKRIQFIIQHLHRKVCSYGVFILK